MADSNTSENAGFNPMDDIVDLVCVLQNILSLTQKGKKVVRRFAELVYVDNYQRMLENCKADDFLMHSISFIKFYIMHRQEILQSIEDDTWISNSRCSIQLGDHDPKLRKLNMILPISAIYDKAEILKIKYEEAKESKRLQKMAAELSSDKGKEEEVSDGNSEEDEIEFLTDKILYYSLCIFRNCLDLREVVFNGFNLLQDIDIEEDSNILDEAIEIIGKGIGITGHETPNNGPLSGLANGITGFLRNSNINGPDGKPIADQLQNIDSNAINSAMSGLFGNKELTEKIISRLTNLNGSAAIDKPEDMTSAMSDMLKDLSPDLANTVVNMIDRKPPPGVTDTRTDEQKRVEKENMQKSISSMMSTAGDIAKSIDPQKLLAGAAESPAKE